MWRTDRRTDTVTYRSRARDKKTTETKYNAWWDGWGSIGCFDIRTLYGRTPQCTVGRNNLEYRLEYRATRSSIRSFARTAHSFACFALLASHYSLHTTRFTHTLRCAHSLSRSLTSLTLSPMVSKWLDGHFFCVFFSILADSAMVFDRWSCWWFIEWITIMKSPFESKIEIKKNM